MDELGNYTPESAENFTAPETGETNEGGLELDKIKFFDNPNDDAYDEVRKVTTFSGGRGTNFSGAWNRFSFEERANDPLKAWEKSLEQVFEQRIKGGILIDLGGGKSTQMLRLAEKFGATDYINVDLFEIDDLGKAPSHAYEEWKPEGGVNWGGFPLDHRLAVGHGRESNESPYGYEKRESGMNHHFVQADMLGFLSCLPSEFGSIVINGVDRHIVSSRNPQYRFEYHRAVANELLRVAMPDGIVFGTQSQPVEELSAKQSKLFTELVLPQLGGYQDYHRRALIRNGAAELPELPGIEVKPGNNNIEWMPNYALGENRT